MSHRHHWADDPWSCWEHREVPKRDQGMRQESG
jgi:hypothetical protein